MASIAEEVLRAATDRGMVVETLPEEDAKLIRTRVEKTFSEGRGRWPLWEEGVFPSAVQDEKAWSWIGTFVGPHPCVLLFNPNDEQAMFRLGGGGHLEALLSETFGFEFYVTDAGATYLLCFNHHGLLLGAGGATSWVHAKAQQRGGV